MKPLWVRLSILISGLLLAVIIATAVLGFVLVSLGTITPDPPFPDDGPGGAEISFRLIITVATISLVGVAAGVVGSRSITAPITRLAEAARGIGAGDLGTRVHVGGSRELVEVGQAFNTMASNLQRSEELRSNLMADVSHELRTPLTALEGNLRAVLDHVYTLDEAEIANLYDQTRHLIRLVNDLRELALAEAHQLPLDKEPTDVYTLVDETVRVFAPLAEEKHVRLAQHLEHLPLVTIDARRMRQVLRHTPPDGVVTLLGRTDAEHVYIAVQDSGVGLAPDQLELVFERFYRTDQSRSRDTGGTGLGLAIVKAIVEAHGGSVAAHSDGVSQGTTFSLVLPR